MKYLLLSLSIIFGSFHVVNAGAEILPTVVDVRISPALDISYFGNYSFSSDIFFWPSTSPVELKISGVNGQGGSCWKYLVDGTCYSSEFTYPMTYVSGDTWTKTPIRPDQIYPEISFGNYQLTLNNAPLSVDLRRNNYHLLHFQNPFISASNMSFWIEFYATPVSSVNSADLQVYLVSKNKSINFFNSDWRSSPSVELVGTINRNDSFNHTHNANSSHFLVNLTANNDGTFGSKNLDINGDFWIILYANSPNQARGWNLKYQPSNICSSSNSWYQGNQSGWSTSSLNGCPDSHVHFARRSTYIDGVVATTSITGSSVTQSFTFGVLTNLPPLSSSFISPSVGGVYSQTLRVNWSTSTDPNADPVTYDLYLTDSNNSLILPIKLASSTNNYFDLDTTALVDGQNYSLKGYACDNSHSCSEYSLPGFFSVQNSSTVRTASNITISSDYSNPRTAGLGSVVTLSFNTSLPLTNPPTVSFYSGGLSVYLPVTVSSPDNLNWTATYTTNANDLAGPISFIISSGELDQYYFESSDGTYVTFDKGISGEPVVVPEIRTGTRRRSTISSNNSSSQISHLTTSSIYGSNLSRSNKFYFMNDLKMGDYGEDVKRLQMYLNQYGYTVTLSGPGSPGNETMIFGENTKKAVMKFQSDNATKVLYPLNLKNPTGIFGPYSRALANGII